MPALVLLSLLFFAVPLRLVAILFCEVAWALFITRDAARYLAPQLVAAALAVAFFWPSGAARPAPLAAAPLAVLSALTIAVVLLLAEARGMRQRWRVIAVDLETLGARVEAQGRQLGALAAVVARVAVEPYRVPVLVGEGRV